MVSFRPLRAPIRTVAPPPNQPTVTLSASFMVYDGYGSMAEFMAVGMARAGVTVNVVPLRIDLAGLSPEFLQLYRSSRPEIRGPAIYFNWPSPSLQRFRVADPLFINTMWETSQLPADWIAPLNWAQAVIVPSRYVADVFRASGVRSPIEVVAQGVDPTAYSYLERPERPGLTTLMVGPVDDRKHTHEGIAAWKKAFAGDPDARLILKSQYKWHNYVPDDLRIRYVDRQEPTRGIAHWYARADVLMALGNEGFGLPLVEAMATGLPVIALDAEGQADVCAEAGTTLLRVPPAGTQEFPSIMPETRNVRAVPGIDDIADRLRWVATHRAEAHEMGRQASHWALEHRNVWTMGPNILHVVQQHSGFAFRTRFAAYMLTCPERAVLFQATVANLRRSDWSDVPRVEMDNSRATTKQERIVETALRLVQRAVAAGSDFIIFLEDDLEFNPYLRHNLEHWGPLRGVSAGGHFFGSLYNPGIRMVERNDVHAFSVADPHAVYGSQAFVFSRATAQYLLAQWHTLEGMPDIRMPRLAARICPIYYHTPSLVQHIGLRSTWGGPPHQAADFSPTWHADVPTGTRVLRRGSG